MQRTYHINDNVLVEGGAIFGGEVADLKDGLGVVSVDVEDGSVDDAADVGAVG
jgi:hypothetical protein